jgi:hypothetical protein
MGELSFVAGPGDFYLAHEHLEETNEPCYFYEFMEQSRRQGLQFLGDAEMQAMATADIPAGVRNRLRAMAGNIEEAEQYQDFIRNRAFRQTLLCREGVALKRAVSPELVQRFHFASSLSPVEESGGESAGGSRGGDGAGRHFFRDAGGAGLEIIDPLARAAVLELQAVWPGCVSFGTLLEKAAARAGVTADARQAATLARALLMCYSASRGMEFYLYPPAMQRGVSGYPVASAMARWQATRSSWVTNLRHENVGLKAGERVMLARMDGTRSAEELERETGAEGRGVLERFAGMGLLVR